MTPMTMPWLTKSANAMQFDPSSDWSGLNTALETQVRLWNQWIDAGRVFWSVALPWMPTGMFAFGAEATVTPEVEPADETPAASDGEDVAQLLQSQLETWQEATQTTRSLLMTMVWPWGVRHRPGR